MNEGHAKTTLPVLDTIRSLAWRSDLSFLAFEDHVERRGDYVVARSPTNPGYWWGNFVLFDRAPRDAADAARMRAVFDAEVGCDPAVRHTAIGWDEAAPGAIDAFEREGLERDEGVVLVATEVHPPRRPHDGLVVRQLETSAEWDAAVAARVVDRDPVHTDAARYATFEHARMARCRRMVDAGLGAWWAAFEGDTLVGDLGIFRQGPLGRFQNVFTRANARGRGVCGTLVWQVSRRALDEGAQSLVMVADPGYHAARIYESVGFVRDPAEHTYGVCAAG